MAKIDELMDKLDKTNYSDVDKYRDAVKDAEVPDNPGQGVDTSKYADPKFDKVTVTVGDVIDDDFEGDGPSFE